MEPSSPLAESFASPSRPAGAEALASLSPLIWPEGGRAVHVPALPGRPTVLFLHGWVMNRSAWAAAAAPLLAHGHGLLLPDLAGHGEAKPLPSSFGPRAFFPEIARRLVLGLDSLGLAQVSLAGYSMGAAAALALLEAAPERIERTFLLGPLVGHSGFQLAHNSWGNLTRLLGNIRRALGGPHAGALWRLGPGLGVGSLPLPDGLLQRVADASADGRHLPQESAFASYVGTAPEACELEVFLEGLTRTDLRTTLRSLRASQTLPYARILREHPAPLRLATGSLDAMSPPSFVRRLARSAPSAEGVEVLEGVDHVALSQAPAEVSGLLLDWLGVHRPLASVGASGFSSKVES